MVVSLNPEPNKLIFQSLLNKTVETLDIQSKKNQKDYLSYIGNKLENVVADVMKNVAKGTPFENSIELISGQKFPDIIDEALAKKVIICSPFSFLIVARTVMESYRNFMVGKKIKEVIKHIDAFASEWIKFDEEFLKFGRSIETLQKNYETLTITRKRQMEKKIAKIEQYRGSSAELLEDGEPPKLLKA